MNRTIDIVMKNMKFIGAILWGLLFLAGCGGSGSSGGGGGTTVATGYFVDAPVKNLHYESGSEAGVTDEFGTFTYEVGQPVEFFITATGGGLISIGSVVSGTDIITPNDLGNTQHASNVASLLQSLNQATGNPNLIELPMNLIADMAIDFSQSDTDFENDPDVQNALTAAGKTAGDFVPQATAIAVVPNTSVTPFSDSSVSDSWQYQRASNLSSTPYLFRFNDDHTGWRRNYDSGVLTFVPFDWSVNSGILLLEYPSGSNVTNEIIGQAGNRDDILFTCTGPCTTVSTNQFVKSKYRPNDISADDFKNNTYTITVGADVYTVVFDDYTQTGPFGSYGFATSSLNGGIPVDLSWAVISSGALVLNQIGAPGSVLFRDIFFPITGSAEDGIYAHFRYSVDDDSNNGGNDNGVGDPADPFVEALIVNELPIECTVGCV